ncbi:MAG TPA: protein kinase [Polyangiaceae bacterium]|jgi:serine/threonine-protein kinase|nr:protein kinase [Polyangiaceae bacterium]
MTTTRTRIGRYEVELPLGEGAVGRVLVSRDPILGRRVALKSVRDDLPLDGAQRAALLERVRQAARSAAGLTHPGLATVHDMVDADAGPYVVFEFLKGPTLRERLANGPLPPSEVAALGKTLGAALSHAHAAGVFFGDVKAENVLFTGVDDPAAKLTEPSFGWLAWSDPALRAALSGPASDAAEALAPAHPAPELLASSRASAHSDQFALAAALYEALTGKRAFGAGSTAERADRMAAGAREPLSVARPTLRSFPHLDTIFDRALARDPRKRFSSCEVFGSVLATELEGFESGRMSASSVSSIVPRATRRWQNAVAGLAVLVIAALIMLGRQPRSSGDGASLTSAASAFSATLAPPRPAPATSSTAHGHAPRATPSGAGSAAAVTPAPSAANGLPIADAASASSASDP